MKKKLKTEKLKSDQYTFLAFSVNPSSICSTSKSENIKFQTRSFNYLYILFFSFFGLIFSLVSFAQVDSNCSNAFYGSRLYYEQRVLTEDIPRSKLLHPDGINPLHERQLQKSWNQNPPTPFLLKAFLPKGVHFIDHQLYEAEAPTAVKLAEPGTSIEARASYRYKNHEYNTNLVFSAYALQSNIKNGGKQNWLVGPNAKASMLFLHGGGTNTTGHHVGGPMVSHFGNFGVHVVSIDLPHHGLGHREFLDFESEIELIGNFVRKYFPPNVPLFVAGHSWGSVFSEKLMMMTERPHTDFFFHKNLKGVIIMSTAVDPAPGKSKVEKQKAYERMAEIYKQKQEGVATDELNLFRNIIRDGKFSPMGGLYAMKLMLELDQQIPAHRGKDYVDAIMMVGLHDSLVYKGNEEQYNYYYRALENMTPYFLDMLPHYKENKEDSSNKYHPLEPTGHLLADRLHPTIHTPIHFALINSFIAKKVDLFPALKKHFPPKIFSRLQKYISSPQADFSTEFSPEMNLHPQLVRDISPLMPSFLSTYLLASFWTKLTQNIPLYLKKIIPIKVKKIKRISELTEETKINNLEENILPDLEKQVLAELKSIVSPETFSILEYHIKNALKVFIHSTLEDIITTTSLLEQIITFKAPDTEASLLSLIENKVVNFLIPNIKDTLNTVLSSDTILENITVAEVEGFRSFHLPSPIVNDAKREPLTRLTQLFANDLAFRKFLKEAQFIKEEKTPSHISFINKEKPLAREDFLYAVYHYSSPFKRLYRLLSNIVAKTSAEEDTISSFIEQMEFVTTPSFFERLPQKNKLKPKFEEELIELKKKLLSLRDTRSESMEQVMPQLNNIREMAKLMINNKHYSGFIDSRNRPNRVQTLSPMTKEILSKDLEYARAYIQSEHIPERDRSEIIEKVKRYFIIQDITNGEYAPKMEELKHIQFTSEQREKVEHIIDQLSGISREKKNQTHLFSLHTQKANKLIKQYKKILEEVTSRISIIKSTLEEATANPPYSVRQRYEESEKELDEVVKVQIRMEHELDLISIEISEGDVALHTKDIIETIRKKQDIVHQFTTLLRTYTQNRKMLRKTLISAIEHGEMGEKAQQAVIDIYGYSSNGEKPQSSSGTKYTELEQLIQELAKEEAILRSIRQSEIKLGITYHKLMNSLALHITPPLEKDGDIMSSEKDRTRTDRQQSSLFFESVANTAKPIQLNIYDILDGYHQQHSVDDQKNTNPEEKRRITEFIANRDESIFSNILNQWKALTSGLPPLLPTE